MKIIAPFVVEWRKVLAARPAFLREMIAAAEHAVRARDEEIKRLRERLRGITALHAAICDRDPGAGEFFSWDYDGTRVTGLWLLDDDRPQRIATIAPGDRVFVLRRKSAAGTVVSSPPGMTSGDARKVA